MCPDKLNHHVVIIPGLSDTGNWSSVLSKKLESEGMATHFFRYPVKEWTIDRAALMLAAYVETHVVCKETFIAVSFVGYGTGSLVERYYISHYKISPARRCVIISDPFHPSDKYRDKKLNWLGKLRFGASLKQLTEGTRGFPTHCGIPPIPFGVIVTGVKKHTKKNKLNNPAIQNSIYAPRYMLKEANDILYTEPSCKNALSNNEIIENTINFLQHGCFKNK